MVVADFIMTKRLHRNCISCLSVFGDVIVTGGKDSCLAIVQQTPNSLETVRKVSILGVGNSKVDVNGVDLCRDFIVCGSSGGLVSIYDINGELCQHMPAHSSAVTCVRILDLERWLLLSTSLDKRGKVWDVRNCKVALHELVGHTGGVVDADSSGFRGGALEDIKGLGPPFTGSVTLEDCGKSRILEKGRPSDKSSKIDKSRLLINSGGAWSSAGGAWNPADEAWSSAGASSTSAFASASSATLAYASGPDVVTFGDQYPRIVTVGCDSTARLWNLNTNTHLAFSAPTLNVEACVMIAKTPAVIFCIATDSGDLLVFTLRHQKPIATKKFPNEWITSMSKIHGLNKVLNTHHVAIGTVAGSLKFIAIELGDNFSSAAIYEVASHKVDGVVNAIFAEFSNGKVTTTLAVGSETRLGRWYCTSAKNVLQVLVFTL